MYHGWSCTCIGRHYCSLIGVVFGGGRRSAFARTMPHSQALVVSQLPFGVVQDMVLVVHPPSSASVLFTSHPKLVARGAIAPIAH